MKNLAKDLIKIANKLDSMGLLTEANSLDKIAKRIVISELKYESDVTGNYLSDIQNYKNILLIKRNESGIGKHIMESQSIEFLQKIKDTYKSPKKEAFLLQAKNIKNEIDNKLDGEYLNNKLSNLLISYKLIDSQGYVNYDYNTFKSYWITYIVPQFDLSRPGVEKWLVNKFNFLVSKLKNQTSPANQ